MGEWTAILILAAAQFVMVLDSSVMNVSISQIVADLDTTISGVQLAIIDAGIPPAEAAAIAADYGAAELDGLRNALLGVALFALLAFWFTRRLRGAPLHAETAEPLPIPA